MAKFYQVYQCHAPSGGVGPVDETAYKTAEEARGAAEALMSQVSEFWSHNGYSYPKYWAQPIEEIGGIPPRFIDDFE